MIARIIVDVPARATNRPFDYLIPDSLAACVEVGSRVTVPFGGRLLLGFVVGIAESSDMTPDKLKPIASVMDLEPPLTRELVELADWMSDAYVCSKIAALQAMIPGALKAKYEKFISLADDLNADPSRAVGDAAAVVRFIREQGRTTAESLLAKFPGCLGLIRRMLAAGELVETQSVKDRLSSKRVQTVRPLVSGERIAGAMEQLNAQAVRQRQVLAHFLEHPQRMAMTDLCELLGVSAASVKALADKGLLAVEWEEVLRDPYADRQFQPTAKLAPGELTQEQSRALQAINEQLESRTFGSFLLHGVTGSGKTEVYLQAIERCLRDGREAIVLVPEISLTPQMVERFKSRFGDLVAVLHSKLSQGERYDEWKKIARGSAKVAVGARSAIFAPFQRIGLIIIDEEHESSYKQEETPKYHAKAVALKRARHHGAAVVLGSATPSLESFHEAKSGELRLLRMPLRVAGRPLPEVQIVDMRNELHSGNRSMFSTALYRAIETRLERKEQMVLLLNRRGFSTFVMCRSCGYTAECPHCDIALTYHRHSRTMRCHYCGYAQGEVRTCPECASEYIRYFGTGTQRVEEELARLFPGIRVIRMDVDTTSTKGAHEKWLTMFRKQEADVLLGTQMVAKGLDFPNVTLVGVIAADTVLHLPDFRAAERTFQLLTQVAGRAGRHHLPGEVVIQTYNPEHYSIIAAGGHDYAAFAERELALRRERGYPPYRRLILITLSHEQLPVLMRVSERLVHEIRQRAEGIDALGTHGPHAGMEVLGPVASPIPRIKDRYRFQCVVKYVPEIQASDLVRDAVKSLEDVAQQYKVLISVDVDPYMLM